ncbi:drug/metabolite exporter YedA [Corallococcus sp. H22C18031201]|nr:drug/metabolite exporter YedA [Citreicoccus inhibens]RJS18409.1 drug/metabolite exporter YedA [Corallococcus sp. H22C18031201]
MRTSRARRSDARRPPPVSTSAPAPSTPAPVAPTSDVAPAGAQRGWLLFCLFALYVIWGSTYLAMRWALVSFPPFLMAGTRFLTAGSLLFAVMWLRGAPLPSPRQWGASALIGFLLLVVGNGGVALAQHLGVPSGVAAVLVGSVPLWAALFGGVFGQWPGRAELGGLALGFAGVVVLNLGGDLGGHPLPMLAMLLAPLSWAFGSVFSRRLPLPQGLMATAAQMLCGGAMMLGISLAMGEHLTGVPEPRAVLSFFYLVVFGSLVAFSAYGYLLRHARPALATSYAYVNPAVAVLLGVGLAGESLRPVTWVAMATILVSVILIARRKR